jgi:hypothetical protein
MGKNTMTVTTKNDKHVLTVDGKEQIFDSKSQLFRFLYDEHEMHVGAIAKLANVRAQFVYSVIDGHTGGNVRKATETGDSKSQLFREMWDKGMKVGAIAKETNSNYTFVHTVIKKYRTKQAADKRQAAEAKQVAKS